MSRVLFGAAYYPEYHPAELLKTDLDLMAEARFSVIRVGESVWSTWEPDDGHFNLDWLQPTLDGAHERGIGVILGTPTYAAPPWLARLYPEIAGEAATGQRMSWGARQEMDFTHAAFASTPSASSARSSSAMPITQPSSVTRSTTSRACTCCTTTASSSAS